MGLKCSILGHDYKPAGVEREREKRGNEVVTIVRDLEQCRRCDAERVVSESTEVTAAHGGDQGGPGDVRGNVDAARSGATGGAGSAGGPGAGEGTAPGPGAGAADRGGADQGGGVDPSAGADSGLDDRSHEPINTDFDPENPAEDDAEILTDEEPEREPGQWPDDDEPPADRTASSGDDAGRDAGTAPASGSEADDPVAGPDDFDSDLDPDPDSGDDESLSGITVPDGRLVCPECSFDVEAQSGYREGDPCPECGAWLESEDSG